MLGSAGRFAEFGCKRPTGVAQPDILRVFRGTAAGMFAKLRCTLEARVKHWLIGRCVRQKARKAYSPNKPHVNNPHAVKASWSDANA